MTPLESRLLALLLVVLTVTGVIYMVSVWLDGMHNHYDEEIAALLDRQARYQRIAAQRKDIEERITQVKALDAGKFFLKNSGPALAAAEIQQLAQGIVEGNGMQLDSMQIIPHKDEREYRRIAVSLQIRGPIKAVQRTLYTLEIARPYLFIDNLTIRSMNARAFRPGPMPGSEPEMQAQFELAGYALTGKKK